MNDYEINTLVQTNASFVIFGTTTPIDPTDINLFVKAPDGTITEYGYPAQISRSGVGNYSFQLVLTEAGIWLYKWQGTGAAEVSAPDTGMLVNRTVFSLSP